MSLTSTLDLSDNNQINKNQIIRNYFVEKDGYHYCQIDECVKKYRNSLTSFKHHIKTVHVSKWELYESMNSKNSDNIEEVDKNVSEKETKSTIILAWTKAFAINSLPHILIEDKYFCEAIKITKDSSEKFPNRKQLRTSIINEGALTCDKMLQNISNNEETVTIALDSLTNLCNTKVINIMLIASGIPYYHSSIMDKTVTNTAEWYADTMIPIIQELMNRNLKVVALTCDTEATMKLFTKLIAKKYPVILPIPCGAHVLQLCLKHICNCEPIKSILSQVFKLIDAILNNKQKRVQLHEVQQISKVKQPLIIKKSCLTRWSSIIDSISRLLILRKYIDLIQEQTTEFWESLEQVFNFIQHFKKLTNIVQKDSSNLYNEYKSFKTILEYYKLEAIKNNNFTECAKSSIELINYYWIYINPIHICAVVVCEFETVDIKLFKVNVECVYNFIAEWGSLYLFTYKIIPNKSISALKSIISFQLSEMLAKQNVFKNINSYIIEFKSISNDDMKYSAKLVWARFLNSKKELSETALALLSICPSEACVERSFSALSDVHTDDRNRLKKDIIEAEMHLKWNIKYAHCQQHNNSYNNSTQYDIYVDDD